MRWSFLAVFMLASPIASFADEKLERELDMVNRMMTGRLRPGEIAVHDRGHVPDEYVVATAAVPEHREITILKGRSNTVTLPFAPGTGMNSNPDVVQGKVDGKNLILMARETGWASYTIYSKDKKKAVEIEITVSDRDVNKIKKDLEQALAEFEQVTVRIAGGDVIVEGEVATVEELQKVNRLLAPYERNGVVNQIAPAP